MKHGDTGFTGILTAGASRAVLNASVQGKRCAYSNVFAEFLYRDTDMVLVEKKTRRSASWKPPIRRISARPSGMS